MMLKFTSEGPSVTSRPRNRKRVLAAARRVGARGAEETFEFCHRGLPAGEAAPETHYALDFARRHWAIFADVRAFWRSRSMAPASAGLATGGGCRRPRGRAGTDAGHGDPVRPARPRATEGRVTQDVMPASVMVSPTGRQGERFRARQAPAGASPGRVVAGVSHARQLGMHPLRESMG